MFSATQEAPALQARSRLREIHAGLLQQQLAREIADADVEAEMGWDTDNRTENGKVGRWQHRWSTYADLRERLLHWRSWDA